MRTSEELPGLTRSAAEGFAEKWDDTGLWADIQILSERVFESDGEELGLRWHHLVMAVGNFKRQPNRRLHPARISEHGTPPAQRPRANKIRVPLAELICDLDAEDADTWGSLQDLLPGAATATTTTVLAALWPDRHFIYDWRVHAAANGLRVLANRSTTPDVSRAGTTAAAPTMAGYKLVRGWLLEAAAATDLPLTTIERSLYELSRATRSEAGRTWEGYANSLRVALYGSG